jgi:hypothetical protein
MLLSSRRRIWDEGLFLATPCIAESGLVLKNHPLYNQPSTLLPLPHHRIPSFSSYEDLKHLNDASFGNDPSHRKI